MNMQTRQGLALSELSFDQLIDVSGGNKCGSAVLGGALSGALSGGAGCAAFGPGGIAICGSVGAVGGAMLAGAEFCGK